MLANDLGELHTHIVARENLLHSHEHKKKEVTTKIHTQERDLERFQDENQQLQRDSARIFKTLETSIGGMNGMVIEHETTKQALSQFQLPDIEQINQRREERRRAIAGLAQQVQEKVHAYAALMERKKRVAEELEHVRKQRPQAAAKAQRYKASLESVSNQVKELDKKKGKELERLKNLRNGIASVENDIRTTNQNLDRARQKAQELHDAHENLKTNVARLKDEKETKRDEHKEELDGKEQELGREKAAVIDLSKKVDDLSKAWSKLKESMPSMKEGNKRAKKQEEEHRKKLQNKKEYAAQEKEKLEKAERFKSQKEEDTTRARAENGKTFEKQSEKIHEKKQAIENAKERMAFLQNNQVEPSEKVVHELDTAKADNVALDQEVSSLEEEVRVAKERGEANVEPHRQALDRLKQLNAEFEALKGGAAGGGEAGGRKEATPQRLVGIILGSLTSKVVAQVGGKGDEEGEGARGGGQAAAAAVESELADVQKQLELMNAQVEAAQQVRLNTMIEEKRVALKAQVEAELRKEKGTLNKSIEEKDAKLHTEATDIETHATQAIEVLELKIVKLKTQKKIDEEKEKQD